MKQADHLLSPIALIPHFDVLLSIPWFHIALKIEHQSRIRVPIKINQISLFSESWWLPNFETFFWRMIVNAFQTWQTKLVYTFFNPPPCLLLLCDWLNRSTTQQKHTNFTRITQIWDPRTLRMSGRSSWELLSFHKISLKWEYTETKCNVVLQSRITFCCNTCLTIICQKYACLTGNC